MKYEELVEECKKDIIKELEELLKLPKDYKIKYSMLIKSEVRCTDCITDIHSINKALEQLKEIEFDKDKYLKVTTEIDTDIDAYAVDNEIIIEQTDVFIKSTAIKPISKNKLEELLAGTYSFNKLFKEYLIARLKKEKDIRLNTYQIDCKLLELYKNGIFDYNQLIESLVFVCKV
jgi:hypothetical protein